MNTNTLRPLTLTVLAVIHSAFLSAGAFNTTTVRVANKTEDLVYCAFYYQRLDSFTRATEPVVLPASNAVTLHLPPTKFFSSRVLALAHTVTMPEVATKPHLPFLVSPHAVGLLAPDDFTLHYSRHTRTPTLTDTQQWHESCEHVNQYENYAENYSYASCSATVTTTPPEEESEFIKQRLAYVHQQQEALLDKKLARPLRIGVCASGGGFRALLATLGLLAGLEDLQMIPSILTFVGLSGSTWAILSWLASNRTFSEYAEDITGRLHRGLMHSLSQQYEHLAEIKKQKKLCGLPMSAIDLYGIGLSHTLLKPTRNNHKTVRFADVADWISPTNHPLVVCTAATRYTPDHPYTWLTFSPFSICQQLHTRYIPSWALGRLFSNGESINNTPPPLLGYAMGMFGSSFSISVRDALERAPESVQALANMLLPSNWYEQITQASWANTKLTAAYLPNFTYQLEGVDNHSEQWLCIVDGGYLNNLPLEPTVAQHADPLDLIIVMDSKRERDQRINTVRAAYESCAAHGYHLAPLADDDVIHNTVTLSHGTPDETSVLYVSLEPDTTFDDTFDATRDRRYITPNLFYSPEASQKLLSFVRYAVTSRADLFRGALEDVALNATSLNT